MKIGASQSSGQWPDDGEAPSSILSRLVVCLSGRRGPAVNRVHDAALVRIQQPPRLAAFGRLFFYRPRRILLGFRVLAGTSAFSAGSFSRAAPGMTTIMKIDGKEPDVPVIRWLCEEAT